MAGWTRELRRDSVLLIQAGYSGAPLRCAQAFGRAEGFPFALYGTAEARAMIRT